jgi:hypothetical protein
VKRSDRKPGSVYGSTGKAMEVRAGDLSLTYHPVDMINRKAIKALRLQSRLKGERVFALFVVLTLVTLGNPFANLLSFIIAVISLIYLYMHYQDYQKLKRYVREPTKLAADHVARGGTQHKVDFGK